MKNTLLDNRLKDIIDNGGSIGNLDEGQVKLLSAWEFTKARLVSTEVVLDDIIWAKNYQLLLDAIKEAGLETIIISNSSTELMDLLVFFLDNGCKIVESTTIHEKGMADWVNPRLGLRLSI